MPLEPTAPTVWTPGRVRELIDESRHWPRYECIDGELLVTPAPRPTHQRALRALFRVLDPYVARYQVGHLLWAPADLELTEGALVQPDLFLVPSAVDPSFSAWGEVRSLRLAVEVLSPSTARRDRGIKRLYYQRAGVPEYWIVDLDARLVERWRPADERPEILRDALVWQPDAAKPPLQLALPALFDDVERWTGPAGEPDV